jgi:hypothetical protein
VNGWRCGWLLKIVILNSFQDNARPPPVILKQVQDDESKPYPTGAQP